MVREQASTSSIIAWVGILEHLSKSLFSSSTMEAIRANTGKSQTTSEA